MYICSGSSDKIEPRSAALRTTPLRSSLYDEHLKRMSRSERALS